MEPPDAGDARPDDITLGRERIGRNIQAFRRLRGMKQTTLGPLVGYTQPTISKIERGKMGITVDWLIRAAGVLGVDLAELTRRETPPA